MGAWEPGVPEQASFQQLRHIPDVPEHQGRNLTLVEEDSLEDQHAEFTSNLTWHEGRGEHK